MEKTQQVANEIQELDALTPSDIASCINMFQDLSSTRLIVTDNNGSVIYSHNSSDYQQGQNADNYQITTALQGYRVFTCKYSHAVINSEAAIPVSRYSTISGCVYMLETDADLGGLLHRLQFGFLVATILLEIVLLTIAIMYAYQFSQRMKTIMSSISILQEGNYEHKLNLGGNDELTILANEFNHLSDRLQISESRRKQFISDASHELKTPLASIKLLSDSILQYDMDMATTKEFVVDIGNEADRLIRMTSNMLALTKNETYIEPDEFNVIHMAPTLERVAKMISGIANERNITIDLNFVQDSFVIIPEDDLYQIAFNLAENGIKYNIPGGKLTISIYRQGDKAILMIEDTGVGIPPESTDHVFERFYRVDKARSRQSGGCGLGLAIVRNIVERNNCKISVQSIVGRGTAFTVTLPRFESNVEEN